MARVLVIEDSPSVRMTLEFCLQGDGYDVVLAGDGMTGLRLAAEQQIDLILLDVNMPVMNGYAVCQALKSDPALRHVPVIMMTSIPTSPIVSRAMTVGAVEVLPKPFELAAFRKMVAHHAAAGKKAAAGAQRPAKQPGPEVPELKVQGFVPPPLGLAPPPELKAVGFGG